MTIVFDSSRTWPYSLRAVQKIMLVTLSKQCINVKHMYRQLAHVESRLCDAHALLSSAQNIRLRWDVALLDSQRLVEEVASRMHPVEFTTMIHDLGDYRILTELMY